MATVSVPRTVEGIFRDYCARRIAVITALTQDADIFYDLCDPGKENLCLYGHSTENWEVTLPADEVPPELPEPVLGINFARDGMNRKDWLSLIAVHSDSWLLSVAFYLGARLNRNESIFAQHLLQLGIRFHLLMVPLIHHGRKLLFSMVNDLPTTFDVVSGKNPTIDSFIQDSGSVSQGSSKRSSDRQVKSNPKFADEVYEDDDDEHSETLCGLCGGNYNANEFWIGCDVCERWFHGKCVKITPAKAEGIMQYKCPSCRMKRSKS